jgi:hypothetical protein
MKSLRVLTVVSALVLFSSCGNDASSRVKKENVARAEQEIVDKTNVPVMTFEETKYDFGDMIEGEVKETVFKFTNTGKSPLIITNARASCGCTIADYPREPIAVGESGVIKAKFNSRGKHGKQNKRITLTTNTDKGRELLYIVANVAKKEKK